MQADTTTLNRLWEFVIPAELEQSQVWVLSAMKKHGPALVRLLWRVLGCEQDVCDAYQETFLKLSYYQSGVKPEKLKSYLFKTAASIAISILRRKSSQERLVETIARNSSGEHYDVVDFDHENTCRKLREAVMKLPEYLRDIIIYHDLGEMNYGQAAKILNITEATARVYRCKAVGLLAVWLNDSEQIK